MKKLVAVLALLAVASVAWGQTSSMNVVSRNGHCFNATTNQMVDCTTGNVLQQDGNPPLTTVVSSGIDGVTLAPGGSTNVSTLDCKDLSAYSQVTALISWSIAAADSDSIQIALKVYNKESNNFGTNDTQVMRIDNMRTSALLDTSFTEPSLNIGGSVAIPRPTLYIYRSTALNATVNGSLKTTINGLGTLPRVRAGNGGVAINLTALCGPLNYVGIVASNWHVSDSMTNFKVVYLCRK